MGFLCLVIVLYMQYLAMEERAGIEVIKLEDSLKLKINHIDWLLSDMCLQAANHCALF